MHQALRCRKTAIKRRALATYEPPAVIRSEALQNVPSPAGVFVTQNSSRQIVKRARHEVNAPPVVPKSVDQLIVPPAYRTYKPIEGDEEQFLLGDSGSSDSQFFNFGLAPKRQRQNDPVAKTASPKQRRQNGGAKTIQTRISHIFRHL
ncbi:hypothetical protein niasHT_017758 [Heterodera trifolii]|uniref:Uncharacterized protein n=1 Tax=Heterodera trifolii TaxID=157864 RepID=A0ABD2LJE4_9BILA